MPVMTELTHIDSSYRGSAFKKTTLLPNMYSCTDVDYKIYLFNSNLNNSQNELNLDDYVFGNNVFMKLSPIIKMYDNSNSSLLYDCVIANGGIYRKNDTTFNYNPYIYLILLNSSHEEIVGIKSVNLLNYSNSNFKYGGVNDSTLAYPKETVFSSSTMVTLDETSAIHIDFGGLECVIGDQTTEEIPESGGQTLDIMSSQVNSHASFLGYQTRGAISDDGNIALFYGGTYDAGQESPSHYIYSFNFSNETLSYTYGDSTPANTVTDIGHIVTYYDGHFYTFEGNRNSNYCYAIHRQDSTTEFQVRVATDSANGISYGAPIKYDTSYFYLFGGVYHTLLNDAFPDVQRLNFTTLTYDEDMIGTLTYGVYRHHAALDGTKVYVTGGKTNSTTKCNHFQIYDMVSNTCTTGTAIPVTVADHVSQIKSGKLYIYGGGLSTIYYIDLSNVDGTQQTTSLPNDESNGWYGCGIAVDDGTAYIFAGSASDGYSSGQTSGELKSYIPHVDAVPGSIIENEQITLKINRLKVNTASDLIKNTNSNYSKITSIDPPAIRFGHAMTKLSTGEYLILGGAFDTTLLNFNNYYSQITSDYTNVTFYDLSAWQHNPDSSHEISIGDLGQEEVLTGKTSGQDFGNSNTAGADGQYVRLNNISIPSPEYLCYGLFIEIAGGAKARCVIHLEDHTDTIYDQVTFPPFEYTWTPDRSQSSYNICVYLDVPKGTKIKNVYWVKYQYI